MASNVRALMAAERQSRRITHELASYTKSGMLTCTACQLSIKSESLWEGHLRSANHKANLKRLQRQEQPAELPIVTPTTTTTTMPVVGGTKRKIDDADLDDDNEENDGVDRNGGRPRDVSNNGETRKKLKPREDTEDRGRGRGIGAAEEEDKGEEQTKADRLKSPPKVTATGPQKSKGMSAQTIEELILEENEENEENERQQRQQTIEIETVEQPTSNTTGPSASAEVDEDEWLAFEKDVAPLTTSAPETSTTTHVITAAPVTAAELEARAAEDVESRRKLLRDAEAQDEKEDEGRRMEEEFEVMEEMEERVRRWREKREALRSNLSVRKDDGSDEDGDGDENGNAMSLVRRIEEDQDGGVDGGSDDDDDDDEEGDDWYS